MNTTNFKIILSTIILFLSSVLATRFEDPRTGLDLYGNVLTIQKCVDWDHGKARSCEENKPAGTIKWIACAIGSSPGGISPNDRSELCSPIHDHFSCKWGQSCYAITSFKEQPADKPYFSAPRSGVDFMNNAITVQQCNNWSHNKVHSCLENRPAETIAWVSCAIGSHPDRAGMCGSMSKGPDDLKCSWGFDCYAVVNATSQSVTKTSFLGREHYYSWRLGATVDRRRCSNTFKFWDIKECYRNMPNSTVGWMTCNNGFNGHTETCFSFTKSKDDFPCYFGNSCYAIVDEK